MNLEVNPRVAEVMSTLGLAEMQAIRHIQSLDAVRRIEAAKRHALTEIGAVEGPRNLTVASPLGLCGLPS